jgi:hypothetical protein
MPRRELGLSGRLETAPLLVFDCPVLLLYLLKNPIRGSPRRDSVCDRKQLNVIREREAVH